MNCKALRHKILVVGLGVVLSAGVLAGCTAGSEGPEGQDSVAGEMSDTGEGTEGSGGEHGAAGEAGGEGTESGGEEASAANLALDETFDQVRAGARLILSYDAASNSFRGTVENTTNNVLTRVRIEVHLSNGTELGPTVPVDMAPGKVLVGQPGSHARTVHRMDTARRGRQRRRHRIRRPRRRRRNRRRRQRRSRGR